MESGVRGMVVWHWLFLTWKENKPASIMHIHGNVMIKYMKKIMLVVWHWLFF
jgi:hypothetical protein